MMLSTALLLLCSISINASPSEYCNFWFINLFWIEIQWCLFSVSGNYVHLPWENVSFTSKSSTEQTLDYWNNIAEQHVISKIKEEINKNKAKNVILFIGDGMSIGTLAASRIYKGQLAGLTGEEEQLSFEKFPVTGLAKVWKILYYFFKWPKENI